MLVAVDMVDGPRDDDERVSHVGLHAARPASDDADVGASRLDAAMDRYADGDDAAFEQVYDALAPRLYSYLLRQTRCPSRAEDLVQQTLLHMHCARGRFVRGASCRPWAFAIARRLMIDGMRRRRPEVALDDADEGALEASTAPRAGADDVLHTRRRARSLEIELSRLPETQRVAFELIKQEGLSLREAAEILGTTVTAIKLRAHRAYVALRAALADGEADGT
jgi:RNA polymerase sigma-70 factor (ECF subfamily)